MAAPEDAPAEAAAETTQVAGAAPLAAEGGVKEASSSITSVPLPAGWEGLSIKLRGDPRSPRWVVTEVPKACFSSAAFAASGAARPQVDGVNEGDEVVQLNGEEPARFVDRISIEGDERNACSSATPPHAVGSKTKFDSPPCVACDFLRRRKALGLDVALQMWLRAVKRDIKITLGCRPGGAAKADAEEAAAVAAGIPLKADTAGGSANCGSESAPTSSVVELKASAASVRKMDAALERLMKLDDAGRDKDKKRKEKGTAKGKGKGKGKRPTGPNLPRTRVTSELVTGEVFEWKGKYGWITPSVPIDHPRASAHKGRLYIHVIDFMQWWVKDLRPGEICRFHVYEDANSLGAEECSVLREQDAWDDTNHEETWEETGAYLEDAWKDDASTPSAAAHKPAASDRSRSPAGGNKGGGRRGGKGVKGKRRTR